jgi:hypothetical protein
VEPWEGSTPPSSLRVGKAALRSLSGANETHLPVPQTPELTYVDPEAPAWDESQAGKNCLIATFSIAIRRLQGRMDFDTAEAIR